MSKSWKVIDFRFIDKKASIVIFMNQLAEGFQTWKNIQERDLNYKPVLALEVLVTNYHNFLQAFTQLERMLVAEFLSLQHSFLSCLSTTVQKTLERTIQILHYAQIPNTCATAQLQQINPQIVIQLLSMRQEFLVSLYIYSCNFWNW